MSENTKSLNHPSKVEDTYLGLDPILGDFGQGEAWEYILGNDKVLRLMAAAMVREALMPRQRQAIGDSSSTPSVARQ